MSIDNYDCESVDAMRTKVRRARKEHWCKACKEIIRRGDLYHYTSYVFDGSARDFKRCARCQLIYAHLVATNADRDMSIDWYLDCGHTYEEVRGVAPPKEIAELAFLTPDEVQARFLKEQADKASQ